MKIQELTSEQKQVIREKIWEAVKELKKLDRIKAEYKLFMDKIHQKQLVRNER